jgi:hypothetical protein
MSTYGRQIDNPSTDSCYGIADKNDAVYPNLRATVFGSMPSDGHAYAMGLLAGYFTFSDPAHFRIGAWATSNGNPAGRKGQTDELDADVRMVDSNGHYYEADLQDSFLVEDGKKYALGFAGNDGKVAHGQTCDGTLMYFDTIASGTVIPDPMGYSHSSPEGKIAVCLLYEPNVAPAKPTNLTPSDGATTTDTTPLYEGDFDDVNEVLPNGLTSDKMSQYQIMVRSVTAANATTGVVVWDSGIVPASVTEQNNRRFSKSHPSGSPLTPGQRYQMCAQVWDIHGLGSGFSAWTDCDFLVSSAGIVTLDAAPTGRITDTTPDFQGRWHHGTGTQMDKVRVYLYRQGAATPLKTSLEYDIANVASSALPGTLFTVPAANTGFGTLASGVEFEYAMQGRDTGGFLTELSPRRSFKTNGKPATPIPVSPLTTSPPSSSRPQIIFQGIDPDGDALTGSIRIKNSGGTVLATVVPTSLGNNLYGFQTTATEVAAVGTFKWDSKTNDGDLDSDYSAEQTFVYANGPTVTITQPTEAEVLSTSEPLFLFTTTDLQKKQAWVYRSDTGALVWDSGLIVSTLAEIAMPGGILDQDVGAYHMFIAATNSAPLTGTSSQRNFTLAFAQPAAVDNFVASPEYAKFDIMPSVIRLRWDALILAEPEKFLGFDVYRVVSGGTFSEAEQRAHIANLDTDTWVDYEPQSGTVYQYFLVYSMLESVLDVLTSVPAVASSSVTLHGSVISDVNDGGGLRAVLGSVIGRDETIELDQMELDTWDGGAGYMYEGPLDKTRIQLKGHVYRTDAAEVSETMAALRALARWKTLGVGTDAVKAPIHAVYRDERGRVIYGRQGAPKFSDQRILRSDVELRFTQLNRLAGLG